MNTVSNLLSNVTQFPSIIKGEDRELFITTYSDINDQSLFTDILDAAITFNIRKSKNSQVNIISKKSINAGGSHSEITIHTESTFSVYLTDADTDKLSRDKTYFIEISIILDGETLIQKSLGTVTIV